VNHFLAERYLADQDDASLSEEASRIHEAVTRLANVQLLSTLYVPGDEVCFYLFESDTADLGGQAVEFDRVVPAVPVARPGSTL
jgi:hypothetical protein